MNLAKLFESWGERIDVTEFMTDVPGFGSSRGSQFSQIYDRADGRYLPVYQNESELKMIRALSWHMADRVPMAQAWCNRLLDYTIGTGFDWTIKHPSPAIQEALRSVVDEVFENSSWTCDLERETYAREVVDGEWLAEIEVSSRQICLATREADELVEPARKSELEDFYEIRGFVPSWSFGVLTSQKNTELPKGYHFVRDAAGTDWDYLDASRVVHWKRNVRGKAKRGYGDFYTPHLYLLRSDRVLTNTAEGAATQAAIAYIVEHAEGSSRSQAESIASKYAALTGRTDPKTGEQQRKRNMAPNTRIDVPNGQKYHAGLLGSNASTIYIQVMESALRLAGTVHAFPEGMLTGSYENNNYASSLTAEAPFVQGRIAEQMHRASRVKNMLKKILRIAVELGLLRNVTGLDWRQIVAGLEVQVEPPKIFPKDIAKVTSALVQQKANGWISDKEAITELGRDYETTKAAIEEENGTVGDDGSADLGSEGGPKAGGQYSQLSRQQWKRNRSAINDIIGDLANGEIEKEQAISMLGMLDIDQGTAMKLLGVSPELNDDGTPMEESENSLAAELFESQMRCPAGYTKVAPLIVNGKAFVGGQFITNASTEDVKAAIKRQDKKARVSQSDAARAKDQRFVVDRFQRRHPASEDMFSASDYLPVETQSHIISSAMLINGQNREPQDIAMATMRPTSFVATRTDLSRSVQVDAFNAQRQVTSPVLAQRADGRYEVYQGHQEVIAAQQLGKPVLNARVIPLEDAERIRAQYAPVGRVRADDGTLPTPPLPDVAATVQVGTPQAGRPGSEPIPPRPSEPVAAPVAAPVTPPTAPPANEPRRRRASRGGREETFGHTPSDLASWMGANGYSNAQARTVIRGLGVMDYSDNAIATYASRSRRPGTPTVELTPDQMTIVRNLSTGAAPIESRSGTIATPTPASPRAARPAGNRLPALADMISSPTAPPAVPVVTRDRLPPENIDHPTIPRDGPGSMRTPANQQIVSTGLRAAEQRVDALQRMDVNGLKQLPRPTPVRDAVLRAGIRPGVTVDAARKAALTSGIPAWASTVSVYAPRETISQHDNKRYMVTQVEASGAHGLAMSRSIMEPIDSTGERYIYNGYFHLDDDAPKGLGLAIFSSQIAEAKAQGFKRIRVQAAGYGDHAQGSGGSMNGYYTWPRFGYAGKLPYDVKSKVETGAYGLPMSLRGATHVEHLMTTQDGRDWMRKHGSDGKYAFELSDNSYSVNFLRNYYHAEETARETGT